MKKYEIKMKLNGFYDKCSEFNYARDAFTWFFFCRIVIKSI